MITEVNLFIVRLMMKAVVDEKFVSGRSESSTSAKDGV